jgi:hypothetical protein
MSEVEGIRARHKSARPKPGIDPAWANAEHDIGLLLKEYDWMRLDRDAHQRVAMRAMERADKAEAALRVIANQSAQDYEDPEQEAYASRQIARTALDKALPCT